jgi:hypothetical protein
MKMPQGHFSVLGKVFSDEDLALWNQVLTKLMHVKIILKNTVNASI